MSGSPLGTSLPLAADRIVATSRFAAGTSGTCAAVTLQTLQVIVDTLAGEEPANLLRAIERRPAMCAPPARLATKGETT